MLANPYTVEWNQPPGNIQTISHTDCNYNKTNFLIGWKKITQNGRESNPWLQTDENIPAIIPNEMFTKEFRQNWVRLIQKVYEVDPLICSKCQGSMKIINFIKKIEIIEIILRPLGFGIFAIMIR